jgi:hypothetical protein
LEVFNSNTRRRDGVVTRTSVSDSTDPPDTERGDEMAFNVMPGSTGVGIINCRIHDVGTGIFVADGTQGTIIYGNLLYNIGWLGPTTKHGPAIYAHNSGSDVANRLTIKHNFFFNGLKTIATQIRSTQSETVIENVLAQENASYGMEISVLNSTPNNITFDGNQIFGSYSKFGENDTSIRKGTGVFTNNYIYGSAANPTPAEWNYWDSLTATGNTLVGGPSGSSNAVVLRQMTTNSPQVATVNGNKYYAGRSYPTPFIRFLNSAKTEYAFGNWRALGYDADGAYLSTPAPNVPILNETKVFPNPYDPGRALYVVWNWQNLAALTLDLSKAGLAEGQQYEIRDAFNWDKGAVVVGRYSTLSPVASLAARGSADRALWIGQGDSTPATDGRFQVFVVVPSRN